MSDDRSKSDGPKGEFKTPHGCQICGERFGNQADLDAHKSQRHPNQ